MPENKRKKVRVQNKAKAKSKAKTQAMKDAIKKLTPAQKKKAVELLKKRKTIRENQDWLKKSKKRKEKNYA